MLVRTGYMMPDPDTMSPDPVTNFAASPAGNSVTLTWNHSASSDNQGAMIRVRSDQPPATPSDGSLVCDQLGVPASADQCVHAGVQEATTYFYTAFSYDQARNFGAGENATATVDSLLPDDVQNLRRTDVQDNP